jgi:hypothetical protein
MAAGACVTCACDNTHYTHALSALYNSSLPAALMLEDVDAPARPLLERMPASAFAFGVVDDDARAASPEAPGKVSCVMLRDAL